MGFADQRLKDNSAACARGEKTRIELPDGQVHYVFTGRARTLLPDGRTLVVTWAEGIPPTPLEVRVDPARDAGSSGDLAEIVVELNHAARRIALVESLLPRDRNAIIGQLRNIAGQLYGLPYLGGFEPVPFGPPRKADEPR